MFNTLGTSNNLAIRDFLNQSSVPQLFVASGATTCGRDYKQYPWTIGYIPSYQTEGIVLARNVAEDEAAAKIAVLYQDDDYGKDLLAGFKRGLGKKAGQIAKAVGYDPTGADVNSQVSELRASKATRLHGLRVRQVRGPVDDPGGQARLASAGLRERGRVLELADVDRRPDRGRDR